MGKNIIMALKTRRSNGVIILEPVGYHIYGSKDFDLKTSVANALTSGDKNFVITLSGIRKMDSSGLGELVLIHQMVEKRGGILKLCDLTKEISSIIKLTKLNVRFQIFPNESKAMASFV
jgi:anti-sigma B factor antagonist